MVIGGVQRQRTFGHLIISGCYRDSRDMWKSLPAFSIGINTPAKNQMAQIHHVARWIPKRKTYNRTYIRSSLFPSSSSSSSSACSSSSSSSLYYWHYLVQTMFARSMNEIIEAVTKSSEPEEFPTWKLRKQSNFANNSDSINQLNTDALNFVELVLFSRIIASKC